MVAGVGIDNFAASEIGRALMRPVGGRARDGVHKATARGFSERLEENPEKPTDTEFRYLGLLPATVDHTELC